MIRRLKRYLFCRVLPLHVGHMDTDHDRGTIFFKCTRCGARVGERPVNHDLTEWATGKD